MSFADLNSKDSHGKSCLHYAILGKQLQMVQFLLSKKVKVDVADHTGDTPLNVAVRVGSVEILEVKRW